MVGYQPNGVPLRSRRTPSPDLRGLVCHSSLRAAFNRHTGHLAPLRAAEAAAHPTNSGQTAMRPRGPSLGFSEGVGGGRVGRGRVAWAASRTPEGLAGVVLALLRCHGDPVGGW